MKIKTIKRLDENIQSSRGLEVLFIALTSVTPVFFIIGVIFIGRTILLERKRKQVLIHRRDDI